MVKGEGTAWDGIFKQSELAEDEVCQFTGDFYDFTYGFIPIKKKTKTKNHHTFLNFPKARNMEERKGLSNPRKADSLQWKVLFSLWSWAVLRVMEERAAPARWEWQNCQTAACTWNLEDFCPRTAYGRGNKLWI